jgi:hypothetical protein
VATKSVTLQDWEVQGLLANTKTAIILPVKPPKSYANPTVNVVLGTSVQFLDSDVGRWMDCPHEKGDTVWVREAWSITWADVLAPGETITKTKDECHRDNGGCAAPCGDGVVYRVGGAQEHPTYGQALWKSSVTMPRWASRLNLEVIHVRVKKLAEVTEMDATSLGFVPWEEPGMPPMTVLDRFREWWEPKPQTEYVWLVDVQVKS